MRTTTLSEMEKLLNWCAFELEQIEGRLILCKREDSYIPQTLVRMRQLIKSFNKRMAKKKKKGCK
jgi:hypothetical protein